MYETPDMLDPEELAKRSAILGSGLRRPSLDPNQPQPAAMAPPSVPGNAGLLPATMAIPDGSVTHLGTPPARPEGSLMAAPLDPNNPKYTSLEPHGMKKFGLQAEALIGGPFTQDAERRLNAPRIAYEDDVANAERVSKENLQGEQGEEARRRGEALTSGMDNVMVTLPDGRTVTVPQKDAAKLIGTGVTANTKEVTTDDTNKSHEKIAGDKNDLTRDIAADRLGSAERMNKLNNDTKLLVAKEMANARRFASTMTAGKVAAPVSKAYGDYQDSISTLNKMNDSVPLALKGDQQAMLNILMNHIRMTMGPGQRMTQQVIAEAEASAPFLGRLNARFDDRGLLSGVVLTPEQIHSMTALGVSSLNNAKRKFEAMRDFVQPGAGGGSTGGGNAVELERGSDGKLRPKKAN